MCRRDLPDAPWIAKTERDGVPEGNSPYDKASDDDLVNGADEGYGWRILAWRLGISPDNVPVDDDFQSVWLNLPRSVRVKYMKLFRRCTGTLLQNYYEQWYELNH